MSKARDWVREARLKGDDRSVLEAIDRAVEESHSQWEAGAQRLEALAELEPAGGILGREDQALIDRLCGYWQVARGRRDLPLHIQALWQPPPRVGEAWFPVVANAHGRILALRVRARRAAEPARPGYAPDFLEAVEAAREAVMRRLPGEASRLRAAQFEVSAPPMTLKGRSVYLAAVAAFAGYASGEARAPSEAWSGLPPDLERPDHARPVDPKTLTWKQRACLRHAAVEEAVIVRPEGAEIGLGSGWLPPPRVSEIIARRSPVAAAHTAAARPRDPVAGALREDARAGLAAADGPLTVQDLFAALEAAGPVSLGEHRLDDLIADDPTVITLDDGRALLARGAWQGKRSADLVRVDRLRRAVATWPQGDPLTPARRAFEGLREALDRAAIATWLADRRSLPARRLGLALACLDAPAPLAELAPAAVSDADGPSLALGLQAIAEVALYLLATAALGPVEPAEGSAKVLWGRMRARPSLGTLAAAAALGAPLPRAQACERVPDILNRWLHHPLGWASLAELGPAAWGPHGDGRALLDATRTLVDAVVSEDLPAEGRWIRPASDDGPMEFYRGAPEGAPRWWRFTRSGGRAEAPPLPRLALDCLPGPLAWAAIAVKKQAVMRDPLHLVAAIDLLIGAWLRLAAALAPPERWCAAELHFTRTTKRRLLALAPDSPLLPDRAALAQLISRLERLEHHPGPIAPDGAFAAAAQAVAAATFEALEALTGDLELWAVAPAGQARRLRGPTLGPVEAAPIEDLSPGQLLLTAGAERWPLWPAIAHAEQGGVALLAGARRARPRAAVARLEDLNWLHFGPGASPRLVPAPALDLAQETR